MGHQSQKSSVGLMWLMSVKLFCSVVITHDRHTCQRDFRQHAISPCYHDNLIKWINQLQRLPLLD